MSKQLNIFTIYTSKDTEMILPVLDHLKTLKQDHNLTIWHDEPILEGQQWKPQMESRLQETDIFFLLLSTDFMYSEFVKQLEFKMLIDTHKAGKSIVIPILLEDCPWDTEFLSEDYKFSFSELEVLPKQRKPIKKWDSSRDAYKNIAASIDEIIAEKRSIATQSQVQEIERTEVTNTKIEEQIALSFDEEIQAEGQKVKAIEAERTVEEEQRHIEAAEANRILEAEKQYEADLEAKKIAQDEKRFTQQATARRIAQEGQKAVEVKETERVFAVAAAKQKEEERRQKQVKETNLDVNIGNNKKILVGSIIALLAIIVVWAFLGDRKNSEKPIPILNNRSKTTIPQVKSLEEIKIDSAQQVIPVSKLVVGDQFEGGMIFSIASSNRKGIIVHMDDMGPMSWQSAHKIYEQLGEGWRLPSLRELELMRKTVGQGATNNAEFANGLYWSATPFGEHQARLLRFRDGNTSYHYNRNIDTRKYRVRAVKDFSR